MRREERRGEERREEKRREEKMWGSDRRFIFKGETLSYVEGPPSSFW
jgi:hypothetical protein